MRVPRLPVAVRIALAKRLRALRLERGLLEGEVALRVGVKDQQVSQWERGAKVPSQEHLEALAQLYAVSPEILLGGSHDLDALVARLKTDHHRKSWLSPMARTKRLSTDPQLKGESGARIAKVREGHPRDTARRAGQCPTCGRPSQAVVACHSCRKAARTENPNLCPKCGKPFRGKIACRACFLAEFVEARIKRVTTMAGPVLLDGGRYEDGGAAMGISGSRLCALIAKTPELANLRRGQRRKVRKES